PGCIDSFATGSGAFFLSYLAEERELAPSAQDQAFNALLFFFRHVRGEESVDFSGAVRSRKRQRTPTVLSVQETERLLSALSGVFGLMAACSMGPVCGRQS
uniref:phage integrase N-terminal SAM-like domain-containing protein n=1 Tax=Cerasicoccus fimbriatus TaxID=3014554 RepID=UPI0022B40BAC